MKHITQANTLLTMSTAAGTLLAASVLLTGCQSTMANQSNYTNNPSQAVTMPLTESKLQHYNWQLVSVTDKSGNNSQSGLFYNTQKPLILSFMPNGRISFGNTCNHLSANYMLTNDNVQIRDITSTRMLCEPAMMTFDRLVPSTVNGQFKLTEDSHAQPVLTVTGANQINVYKPVNK